MFKDFFSSLKTILCAYCAYIGELCHITEEMYVLYTGHSRDGVNAKVHHFNPTKISLYTAISEKKMRIAIENEKKSGKKIKKHREISQNLRKPKNLRNTK